MLKLDGLYANLIFKEPVPDNYLLLPPLPLLLPDDELPDELPDERLLLPELPPLYVAPDEREELELPL